MDASEPIGSSPGPGGPVRLADLGLLPPVLTVEEAAKLLRISRAAAYEAARAGTIPTVKIGCRRVLVPTRPLLGLLGLSPDEPRA